MKRLRGFSSAPPDEQTTFDNSFGILCGLSARASCPTRARVPAAAPAPAPDSVPRQLYPSGHLKKYAPRHDLAAGRRQGLVATWFASGRLPPSPPAGRASARASCWSSTTRARRCRFSPARRPARALSLLVCPCALWCPRRFSGGQAPSPGAQNHDSAVAVPVGC